jgi:threonine/homoserine/homoserine lactone efflux protein
VGVGRVFVTTLLNPKALIFAFTLLPPAEAGAAALLPALAGLAVMIAGAGAGWIAIGAVLRQGLDAAEGPRTARRAGAVALLGFAGLISARVAGFA